MGDLKIESWGRYPRANSRRWDVEWASDPLPRVDDSLSLLPFGKGRSYGDSCLNDGGISLATARLDRFIAFDERSGILKCEAGVTLEAILTFAVPRGWFLPVTPGTKFVTLGGAVANDIHGKNHHRAGTLGEHVTALELLRSDGTRRVCSPALDPTWFEATIGGLGLTGLITWVELRLRKIESAFIDQEKIRFRSFEQFLELATESENAFESTVAWIDCASPRSERGLFIRGSFASAEAGLEFSPPRRKIVPFEFPEFALNSASVRAFNALYFHQPVGKTRVPYEPFFYPLDAIHRWNRIYGKSGFVQHQFVVPFEAARSVRKILGDISSSGCASFLAVLKTFGVRKPVGLLSFPRPGITLALDFRFAGGKTLALLDRIDAIVRDSGGALYPAKDARMSPETFRASFPRLDEFEKFVDPRFSSSLWRRLHR